MFELLSGVPRNTESDEVKLTVKDALREIKAST